MPPLDCEESDAPERLRIQTAAILQSEETCGSGPGGAQRHAVPSESGQEHVQTQEEVLQTEQQRQADALRQPSQRKSRAEPPYKQASCIDLGITAACTKVAKLPETRHEQSHLEAGRARRPVVLQTALAGLCPDVDGRVRRADEA